MRAGDTAPLHDLVITGVEIKRAGRRLAGAVRSLASGAMIRP
jgi:hypothetical protein